MPNKIIGYFKEKKKGFVINIFLFIFLIITLFFRKYDSYIFVYSILAICFFFLFTQYYAFESRIYVICALILLATCPFLLIFNQNLIAEGFSSYAYGFLSLGIIGFFLDNLREKSRGAGKLKIYKFFITFFISLLIVFTIYFYFNNFLTSFRNLQMYFLKETNEQKYFTEYYKSIDRIFMNGRFINEEFMIGIFSPREKLKIADQIYIEGWALDKNSKEGTGIEKVEIWLDGEPGNGEFLGNANLELSVDKNIQGQNINEQKYFTFSADIKLDKVKDGDHKLYIYALSELFGWKNEVIEFVFKNYTNDEKIKEAELNNNEINNDIKIFIDKPAENQRLKNSFEIEGWALDLNSPVYSHYSGIDKIEIWLDGYPGEGELLYEGKLNKERSDIAEVFGSQFLNSGYKHEVDLYEFGKGEHNIFVFIHSAYSGWKSENVVFEVE